MSIWRVEISSVWLTRYVVLRRWCASWTTISSLRTTDGVIAAAGMLARLRNRSTATVSRRRRRAAPVALAASPRTVSDHWTRFALIGSFADAVTPIVSCVWRASWIAAAATWETRTNAMLIDRRPRKTSGSRKRCTGATMDRGGISRLQRRGTASPAARPAERTKRAAGGGRAPPAKAAGAWGDAPSGQGARGVGDARGARG